ncbi:protein kinase domain-containing protein [Gordonia sp. NPDC003950]
MLLQPGATFAGYRVIRRLGAGGMGQVYLVEHPSLHRREALKIISANTDDPDFFHRFANEARVAASLDHPGIVTVHAHGVDNGTPWFTMSYLEGSDLYHSPALPIEDVSHIIGRVADALDYAHARRIIHRDIKPDNIVITTDPHGHPDRVTVLDFGIARLIDAPKMTATSAFIGTLAYAAPEVLNGAPATPASDQYALACTAFTLLTGTPPFPATNPATSSPATSTPPYPDSPNASPHLRQPTRSSHEPWPKTPPTAIPPAATSPPTSGRRCCPRVLRRRCPRPRRRCRRRCRLSIPAHRAHLAPLRPLGHRSVGRHVTHPRDEPLCW